MAPGSPPDDPVRGLVPCFIPPRMLQSGASFYRILSVASDAPVRGTWFTPGRSSPGASAVLHSAPDAPIRGVFLSYSLSCLGCSSPWHRVLPRTIQSGGLGRAPLRPGCSNPGRLFVVFSPLPRTLQSVAPGSPPDDPVRGLGPSSTPPRMLQSGASCILLSLLSLAFACVVHWCFFFFARPSSLLLPRSPRSALLSLPPFPLPLCPRLPRSRFSLPLLPPAPFVVALLGHALMHLVSTRACCYVLGRAHSGERPIGTAKGKQPNTEALWTALNLDPEGLPRVL